MYTVYTQFNWILVWELSDCLYQCVLYSSTTFSIADFWSYSRTYISHHIFKNVLYLFCVRFEMNIRGAACSSGFWQKRHCQFAKATHSPLDASHWSASHYWRLIGWDGSRSGNYKEKYSRWLVTNEIQFNLYNYCVRYFLSFEYDSECSNVNHCSAYYEVNVRSD